MPENNADNFADNTAAKEKIAEMRAELYALVEKFGLDHAKVLEFSRKLDLLILELS